MTRSFLSKAADASRALLTREIPLEFERIPLPVRKASYRKVFNWLAVEAGVLLNRTEPWGMPTHFQVEPSSRCNLRCTYCPVGSEVGDTGHMNPATFKRLVDEVHHHAMLLILWGWGEPFVCPSVYEMIDYAHRHGLRIVSSTNGHLFTRREHAEGIVHSGLDALIVSLSGTTQEAYARFRSGPLEEALNGTREIVAAKRRLGSATPHVQLSFIVTDYSESEVPGLLELARGMGVDGLSLKRMNTASVKPRQGPDEALPKDEHYRRFRYAGNVDGDGRVRVKDNPCKHLWHSPTLRWDGRINPCAYDFDGDFVLGDTNSSTFEQIWHGREYQRMREQFRTDWEGIPICSRCTYAYAGGNYDEVVSDCWIFSGETTRSTADPERADPFAEPVDS